MFNHALYDSQLTTLHMIIALVIRNDNHILDFILYVHDGNEVIKTTCSYFFYLSILLYKNFATSTICALFYFEKKNEND